MRVHLFCADILPQPGRASSAGGMRSRQLLDLLQHLGHEVSWSEPDGTFLARRAGLAARHGHDRLDQVRIIEDGGVELAIYANPMVCALDAATKQRLGCRILHDINGPVFLESALLGAGSTAGELARYLERLQLADGLVAVSELQRGAVLGWLATLGLAATPWIELLPLELPTSTLVRELSPEPSILFAGYIYPWQDPSAALLAAADHLERRGRGDLWLVTGHHDLPNMAAVDQLLGELSRRPRVRLMGILPESELQAVYARAWCCLEVMARNVERELAFTARTWQQLGHGIPVITSDHSGHAARIVDADAGWVVDVSAAGGLERALDEALGDRAVVLRKGENARRLIARSAPPAAAIERLARRLAALGGPRPGWRRGTRSGGLPRVLLVAPEKASAELRCRLPLDALAEAGRIAGYCHVDAAGRFRGPQDYEQFDCIVAILETAGPIVRLLADRQYRFACDIDELPVQLPAAGLAQPDPLLPEMVRSASVLTMPTGLLTEHLGSALGFNAAARAMVIPDGLPFPRQPPALAGRVSGLVWTASDLALLARSREAIVAAIADFAGRHALPVHLFGTFDDELLRALPTARPHGDVEFWKHKQFFAAHAGLIGLAPLEDKADPATQRFLDSRSDFRMVEHGGYGHPGVYSRAAPYLRTDLATGSVVENSYQGWSEGLREAAARCGEAGYVNAAEIRERRDMARLALGGRLEAIERAIEPRGIMRAEIERCLASAPSAAPASAPAPAAAAAPERRMAYRAADRFYRGFDRLPLPVQHAIARSLRALSGH
jgi:glycosyltransferase involved in cell wall biosynthesis